MTENGSRRELAGLSLKEILNFASSLFLPLMLGIFTVVITFQQQRVATEQRIEDRWIAERQREQDFNLSNIQRQEDRQSAQDQRDQDLRNWILQREQDMNNSRQQRDLDRQLADEKRQQDYELANATRMMSEKQRDHELDVELQRHRDSLFVAYMNELALLLDKNNGTITSNPVTAALVRAKTLTLARQLDPARNSHLIRFLFEVGQLTDGARPLDLSSAELNSIDLSTKTRHTSMRRLSLVGAHLVNASFAHQDLSHANFHHAHLSGALFTDAILFAANFSETKLEGADFSHAQIHHANLAQSDLQRATFFAAHVVHSNFSLSNLVSTNCSYLIGDHAIFLHTELDHCDLSQASLRNSTFLRSSLNRCDLSGTDLSGAILTQSTVTFANLANATLLDVTIQMANLSHANLRDAIPTNFSFKEAISAHQTISPDGTIIQDKPMVANGHIECGLHEGELFGWIIDEEKKVITLHYPNDRLNCYLAPVPNSTEKIRMHQTVHINEKYGDLIREQRARLIYSARFGSAVRVDLNLNWHHSAEYGTTNIVGKYTTTRIVVVALRGISVLLNVFQLFSIDLSRSPCLSQRFLCKSLSNSIRWRILQRTGATTFSWSSRWTDPSSNRPFEVPSLFTSRLLSCSLFFRAVHHGCRSSHTDALALTHQ